MLSRIYILHEYGVPRHFEALYYLKQKGIISKLQSMEFNIHRQIAKGIVHHSIHYIQRGVYNIKSISTLLRERDQIIVIGAAPYDPIVPLLHWLKEKNKIIYFTSWPYWDGDRYVKRPLSSTQVRLWHQFLEDTVTVTITRAAQQAVLKHGAQAIHIPHSVDTGVFKPLEHLDNSSIIKVLFVGSLIKRKGVHLLLESIKESKWQNVEFWFLGRGPYSKQIMKLQTEYPIKYFGYIGDRNALAQIYRQSDIFVLPSIDGKDIENFGIAIIEAMAAGLPVVATDCVGPGEIVDDGQNGLVIRQNDKEDLREGLGELIRNPVMRRKMGEAGREKALKLYDIAVIAQRWESVLRDVHLGER